MQISQYKAHTYISASWKFQLKRSSCCGNCDFWSCSAPLSDQRDLFSGQNEKNTQLVYTEGKKGKRGNRGKFLLTIYPELKDSRTLNVCLRFSHSDAFPVVFHVFIFLCVHKSIRKFALSCFLDPQWEISTVFVIRLYFWSLTNFKTNFM